MRKHGLTIVGDWIANQRIVGRPGGVLPAHLLRFAFENAENFAALRDWSEEDQGYRSDFGSGLLVRRENTRSGLVATNSSGTT